MHASYINVIYRIKYFTTKMTVKKLIYKIFFVVIKKTGYCVVCVSSWDGAGGRSREQFLSFFLQFTFNQRSLDEVVADK